MDKTIYLGSHLSIKSPDYFLQTVKDALLFNENTFMFYTGAPQSTFRIDIKNMKIEEGLNLIKNSNINLDKLVVHAPYLINLANSDKNKAEFSKKLLISELEKAEAFNVNYLVLHPGSHMGKGSEIGLKELSKNLNEVLSIYKGKAIICLETMAGKGNEVGSKFSELSYVLENIIDRERVGICLDTCHINDAGYNVKDVDSILKEFDSIIGLEKLKVVHLNDSQNEMGSRKDRHANIGKGTIGFSTLYKWLHHPLLVGLPFILETPYINNLPPYKEEIEMLRK